MRTPACPDPCEEGYERIMIPTPTQVGISKKRWRPSPSSQPVHRSATLLAAIRRWRDLPIDLNAVASTRALGHSSTLGGQVEIICPRWWTKSRLAWSSTRFADAPLMAPHAPRLGVSRNAAFPGPLRRRRAGNFALSINKSRLAASQYSAVRGVPSVLVLNKRSHPIRPLSGVEGSVIRGLKPVDVSRLQ